MHANSDLPFVMDVYLFRYLALVTALASEADYVFIPEAPPSVDWQHKLCDKLEQASLHPVYILTYYTFYPELKASILAQPFLPVTQVSL